MKIAILSDIHANFHALQKVLEDIETQKCDKVLCLGDLAMAGAQPRLVIDLIRKQDNWIIIQGNTDKMIAEYTPELYEQVEKVYPVMANALKDDVKILEDDKKEFLKNLPEKRSLLIEGVKVLMVHGSPRRNNEDILPNMPIEDIEKMLEGVQEDLIFCGHTHIPCAYQTNSGKTVVNVGSVGRPMTSDKKACYVIAEFENGSFTIEHRLLDYERLLVAQIISLRGFKGCTTLADMIINPQERHA